MEAMTFVGIPFYSLAKYRAMGSAVQSLRDVGIVQRLSSGNVLVRVYGGKPGIVGWMPTATLTLPRPLLQAS